ncbi:MAG TPA: hypothetical protein VMP11_12935 [Verrucomicrobiae bacterium]|nr:hypothetical protein [Verrucomicrobiae bacterium]
MRLQQRNRGNPVDDIIVEGVYGSEHQHLYVQAKHRIQFSSNPPFGEVISAAYAQFSKADFKRGVDRIGLAIGEACNNSTVRNHVNDVLSWARAADDAVGYYQQVGNFPSKVKVLRAFEKVLGRAAGRKLAAPETHAFLKHLFVLPFDFDTITGRDSETYRNRVLDSLEAPDPRHAKALFDILFGMCAEYAPKAGTITRDAIAARIAERASFSVPALRRAGASVMQLLRRQIRNRVAAEKNSKKYIPSVFVEIEEIKDGARLFCHPALFLQQLEDEIRRFNLRGFNRMLRKARLGSLSFGIPRRRVATGHFKTVAANTDALARGVRHLLNSASQIAGRGGIEEMRTKVPTDKLEAFDHMSVWLRQGAHGVCTYRIPKLLTRLQIAKARVLVITSRAGQGKTNFICDFVEHFALPKEIPCAFFTGRELRGVRRGELCQHLARAIYFAEPSACLDKLLGDMEAEAAKRNVAGVIVIDALNEHDDLDSFSAEVETLIERCMDYGHLRVLLTCRSEYFEARFGNLENSSFGNRMAVEKDIHIRMGIEHKERLFWGYLGFFNIKCTISKAAFEKLTNDPFLLRLFCEAYGDPEIGRRVSIGFVRSICKDELFRKYLSKKLTAVAEGAGRRTGFLVGGEHPYKKLLMTIAEWMIANRRFANVPVDGFGQSDLGILTQLIDEDIFLRKDLGENAKGGGRREEVISFTFDEFRDFLLADHLLTTVLQADAQRFEALVQELTQPTCSVAEGVSQYLFFGSRYIAEAVGLTVIKKQSWYDHLFVPYAFDLPDAILTPEDIARIRQMTIPENRNAASIFAHLIWRCDTDSFRNASILLLFEIIDALTEDAYRRLLHVIFDESPFSAREAVYPLSVLAEHLRPSLLARDRKWEKSSVHLARLLLYLWDVRDRDYRWLARELFADFEKAHAPIAQNLCAEHVKNARKGFKGSSPWSRSMTNILGAYDDKA